MNFRLSRLFPLGLALVVLTPVVAQPAPPPAVPPAPFSLETYADLGFVFGENGKFTHLGWTDAQFEAFVTGLRDSFHGKPHDADARTQALHDEVGRRLQQVARQGEQQMKDYFKDPAKLAQFMKDACKAYKLELSDSGLGYAVRAQNGSVRPEPGDTVVISCRVRAADGKTELAQLSLDHKPVRISEMLPGPAEGVQMMTVGSTVMLLVPPDLSYGAGTWPAGVEAGTPLFFLMTLEKVIPGS